MRRPVFINLAVDRSSAGCVHAHSYLGVPIDELSIGCFQAIRTDVLLIFSFITGDKTEFLSPMMFSNEYITGI